MEDPRLNSRRFNSRGREYVLPGGRSIKELLAIAPQDLERRFWTHPENQRFFMENPSAAMRDILTIIYEKYLHIAEDKGMIKEIELKQLHDKVSQIVRSHPHRPLMH